MKFGFVCTNYYNFNVTKTFIDSLVSSEGFNKNEHIIVIVDNSTDTIETNNLNNLILNYPFVILLSAKENLGYFPGLNIGIKYIRTNYPDINNILIGNNDLSFDKDFILSLNKSFDYFKKYPVISPDIITLDNVHQNPHVKQKVSFWKEILLDIYFSNYFLAKTLLQAKQILNYLFPKKSLDYLKECEILQGYGACYILTSVFFNHFDSLFAPTFLMGEEAFLTIQIQKIGFNVFYTPKIKINHIDHATIKMVDLKKFWKISSDSHKIYRSLISRTHNEKI